MQTIAVKPAPHGTGLLPLLAGVAVAVAGAGAYLVLTAGESPLRGPCALFLLLAAPASAVGAALHGMEPWGRLLASLAGAVAIDMLVAQAMLAFHRWSATGGVAAVTALSSLILLLVLVRRLRGRTARRRTS
ncbi:hypothetical protein ACFVT5_36605 [Streptomyces sp. NPDC058001]|uniref:hypothetical protein n=1 Tax=Streptomyces sp. NPDC058001 TaxID=3346300 RepID=UPI0036E08CD0